MEEISSRRAFCLAKAGGRTPMEIKWGCGDEEPLSGSTAQAPETEEAGEPGARASSQYSAAIRGGAAAARSGS